MLDETAFAIIVTSVYHLRESAIVGIITHYFTVSVEYARVDNPTLD